MFLVVLLGGAIGPAAYRINVFLSGDMESVLDDVRIAELREGLRERRWDLVERKEDLESVRTEVQNHIDALGVRLGELQAQMFRINGLGQRLSELSGLEAGEFDFSIEPGVGGIPDESGTSESYEYPEFLARLDDIQLRLQYDENRLAVMESLLIDKKVSRTMFPDAWPVKSGWMSSLFGYRSDPFTGRKAFHSGSISPAGAVRRSSRRRRAWSSMPAASPATARRWWCSTPTAIPPGMPTPARCSWSRVRRWRRENPSHWWARAAAPPGRTFISRSSRTASGSIRESFSRRRAESPARRWLPLDQWRLSRVDIAAGSPHFHHGLFFAGRLTPGAYICKRASSRC
ncbi:MAG: hypothetical protein M5U09_23430 [Gammaproteobacteria bacterium]|nr:hypothetical protein [Gammaproteobacteria bacterium]